MADKLVVSQGLGVDYSGETAEGLVVCPNDIDPSKASNFIIDWKGTVFAIEFGRTGYIPVPPSYVSCSLESAKSLMRLVARRVKFPKSANVRAVQLAGGRLVISGSNSLGK